MAVDFHRQMMDILDALSDKVEERGALFHMVDDPEHDADDTDLYARAFMLRKALRAGSVKIPSMTQCSKGHDFAFTIDSPGDGVFPDCPHCMSAELAALHDEVQELRTKHYG